MKFYGLRVETAALRFVAFQEKPVGTEKFKADVSTFAHRLLCASGGDTARYRSLVRRLQCALPTSKERGNHAR